MLIFSSFLKINLKDGTRRAVFQIIPPNNFYDVFIRIKRGAHKSILKEISLQTY